MSSAISFNLDLSKILSSGNGLIPLRGLMFVVVHDSLFSHCLTLPNKPWFLMCLQYKSFENTVGKGEIAHNEHFLRFPQRFLPVQTIFCHFHKN